MLVTLVIALALIAGVGPEVAVAQPSQINFQARQQIQALLAEKAARTPAQHKVSSRLLYQMKMERGEAIANGLHTLRTGVQVAPDSTTLVNIKADVTEEVLTYIKTMGGTVINSFPQYQTIRARIPLGQVEALALHPKFLFIRPADEGMAHSHDANADNVSEGDVAHRADQARATFGVDGSGIKVGVMSLGIKTLADRQASGDLPDVTVLPGQAGPTDDDEGTAMLEIVHDLAPGAELLYATAANGEAQFAANIEALRAAGADVIVDDVFYIVMAAFQDGIVAQAVESVVADGAVFFSSAGNFGNLNDGTSGVWEGDFSPTASPASCGCPTLPAHDFGGGTNSVQITQDSPRFFALKWSDPQGGSANDYDLFLLTPDLSTLIAFSINSQTGAQDPLEVIDSRFRDDVNNRLVIIKFSGADRYIRLNTFGGQLSIGTAGQTYGHPAAENAIGVAAVDVATAGSPFTGGAANPVEVFSSDGPRRIFFQPDGTPITPGNFSATGGTVLQKPDITAADGVSTAAESQAFFNPFFGTSASAPHAAAIAALVLDSNSLLTPAQVRDALVSTALDIEAPGVDRDSGHGIIDAFAAVQATIPVISVTPNSLDFGSVNVGESADLDFTVQNTGGGTLNGNASTSAPFSIQPDDSYSLASEVSQATTVRFSPTSAGTFMGNVSFTGGGGVSKMVTGTGISSNTNFSLADLEGGWSGSANSALGGSLTMTITFGASGNVTGGSTSFGAIFTGGTLSINSSTGALSGTIFFDASGTSGSCTVGSGSQLNAAKTTLTGSVSCTDGDQITSIFLTKQPVQTFTLADMQGTWSGSANSALRGSLTMTITFGASGNVTGGSTSFGAIFTGGTLSINSSTGALSGTILVQFQGQFGSCTVGSGSQLNSAKTTFSGRVSCTDGDQITSILLTSQQAKATLTVNIVGSGDGTVTGTGISCRTDCSEVFNSGTSVTLTATADPGSTFAGFSGGGCSGTGPCTVIVNADTTVTATYSKIFTDDPLSPGVTVVTKLHITELRQAVNQLRSQGGLGSFLFTDQTLTAGITTIKRVHITELRTALTEAAAALGKPAPNFPTDPTIVAGQTVVKMAHIEEIRTAISAVESIPTQ